MTQRQGDSPQGDGKQRVRTLAYGGRGESIRAGYPSAVDERTGSGGREETTGTGGNAAVRAQGAEGKRTGWQQGPGKTSGPRREEERRTKSS